MVDIRMKPNRLLLLIIAATALPLSKPCQAAVQSPSPQVTGVDRNVDPTIIVKAKEWFHRFQTGKIDRSQLSDAMIAQEAATLRRFGDPSSFEFIRKYAVGGAMGYAFLLRFSAGRIV